jgi:general secretion pathway protein M
MKAGFLIWWRGRSLREQRMLLALALVAAGVLGWLLILRPLGDSLASARERHHEAVVMLAETRARVEALTNARQGAQPAAAAPPLATLVSGAASEAGFSITRLDSDPAGQVTLAIAAARPQAFFAWVAGLEQRNGVIVERLTASTNTDQTLTVQATFRQRRG